MNFSFVFQPSTRILMDDETKPTQSIYTRFVKPTATIKLKNGGAVDPASKLDQIAHIYELNDVKYNAVLGLTDIQSDKNSYYKIQLLEADKRNQYWVFTSWGRIGTTIGSCQLDECSSSKEAVNVFESYFLQKTGNRFKDKNQTEKPGKYCQIDIDYSEDKVVKDLNLSSEIPSKLEKSVQNLVRLLFDVNLMKKQMLVFELDTNRMPLGKLSKKQIQSAFGLLNKLSTLIAESGNRTEFIALSNQFYSLIPYSSGVKLPPVLDTLELIKTKTEMLDSLLEIELAYSLLNSEIDDEVHPLDAHYDQLKTEIVTIDRDSDEFKMLEKYVKNTHAHTHNEYSLRISDAFKVNRKGEDKKYKPFKKLHNRKLLWHGSRLTNFVGILSHGLKIAPPEAPATGYMFGKGIYFADMVSKSANYCFTTKTNTTGLMLLCEVALGDMLECNKAQYITELPKNKHSTMGIGKTQPEPEESVFKENGVEIPFGTATTNCDVVSSLLYNEYIVYDPAQVNVQYLVKMDFNYK